MTIERNGIKIELTKDEVYAVFKEAQITYAADDIITYFNDMDEVCPYSKEELLEMGKEVMDGLYNNDDYYEIYWESIRNAIEK